MTQWLDIPAAAAYASVSVSTIRNWLRDGMRYTQPGRKILTCKAWIDEYLERYSSSQVDIQRIVDEACNF